MITKDIAKDFKESDAEQLSPQWFADRVGKPSASRLGDLMARLKPKKDQEVGDRAQKSKDYLDELAYEKAFGHKFEKFTTQAMQTGVDYEDLVAQEYAKKVHSSTLEAHSYISDYFVATPDRKVVTDKGEHGLLECKVLGDNSFADLLRNGICENHRLQVQGQLMATGADWCDYAAVNLSSHAIVILRQTRDDETIEAIYKEVKGLDIPEMPMDNCSVFSYDDIEQYDNGKDVSGLSAEEIAEIDSKVNNELLKSWEG